MDRGITGVLEDWTALTRILRPRCSAFVLLAVLIFFGVAGSRAQADWISLNGAEVAPNIAEFHVEDDGVRVVLEAFVGGLENFMDLVPAEWRPENGEPAATDAQRVARFGEETLVIRTGDGDSLPATLIKVERSLRINRSSPLAGTIDPYSGRKYPEPPEDERVLYAELFYAFGETRPDVLEFFPPGDTDDQPMTVIGMVVFHRAVPVIDFRYLSAPARLTLDWQDPWFSHFDNPNLKRHHKYPRMVFLYAEPYEIRHEALIRVRDAAELVGLEPAGQALTATEASTLLEKVAEAIGASASLSIEGTDVTPDFDRGAFMRIGQRGLEILAPGAPIDVDAGILGLIWSAPTDGLPKYAELEWSWFDEASPEIAGYAIDAAGPFLSPISADDPILKWTNHFKKSPYPEIAAVVAEQPDDLPFAVYILGGIIAMGIGQGAIALWRWRDGGRRGAILGFGAAAVAAIAIPVVESRQAARVPELDQEQLVALSEALLNNVYRAFDFRLEDQVYDRLALTLEGEILEEVYLAQREALRIERAGGADARVDQLQVTAVEPLPDPDAGTVRLRTDWTILGSVGHWGHIHRRTNAYQADLTLAPVDGAWEIREFDVLSQERLL